MSQFFAIIGRRNLPTPQPSPSGPGHESAGPAHARFSASPPPSESGVAIPQPDTPVERLLKMIPGEAVSFYSGSIASLSQLREMRIIDAHWHFVMLVAVTLLSLMLLVAIRWRMTKDPSTLRVQWQPILIASLSFLIYAYTIGGPFQYFPLKIGPGWLAPLGMIVATFWTAFTPYLFDAN